MTLAEVDAGAASVDVARAVLVHEAQAMARLSDKFSQNRLAMQRAVDAAVSYTHLTLPTICSE